MNNDVRAYLAKIGQKGGQKSRRHLAPETAKAMVRLREARRTFRQFHAQCFWSFDPDYLVRKEDIPWVIDQLKKHGDRSAFMAGMKL